MVSKGHFQFSSYSGQTLCQGLDQELTEMQSSLPYSQANALN